MRRRFVLLAGLVVVAALVAAPAASAWTIAVSGIEPDHAPGGTTVSCTVVGSGFDTAPDTVTDVRLTLSFSSVAVVGTVTGVGPVAMAVDFALPSGLDWEGVWDLTVTQTLATGGWSTFTRPSAFTIDPPGTYPTLTTLDPPQTWAGYAGTGTPLTVNGSGFVSGASIWFGWTEKSTDFISSTQLLTAIQPSDVSATGSILVSVVNPPSPGFPSTNFLLLPVVEETTDPTVTIEGGGGDWQVGPVTLHFVAEDAQSGVRTVQFRCPPAVPDWFEGAAYAISGSGAFTVEARAFDECDHVGSATTMVKIDNTEPQVEALNAVSVATGRRATMRFLVSEPAGLSPLARVTLRIKTVRGHRTVKLFRPFLADMNVATAYSFRCRLPAGRYRWYADAVNEAGTAASLPASRPFVVH